MSDQPLVAQRAPGELEYWSKACDLVADELATCSVDRFDDKRLKLVAILRNAAFSAQRGGTDGLCPHHGCVVIGIGGCHACAEEAWGWKARADKAETELALLRGQREEMRKAGQNELADPAAVP